jgi:hypothetical protein
MDVDSHPDDYRANGAVQMRVSRYSYIREGMSISTYRVTRARVSPYSLLAYILTPTSGRV